jgi:thermolysin
MGAALTACLIASSAFAQARATAVATSRSEFNELRAWDQRIDSLIRSRDLVVRESMRDSMLPERTHERFDQYVRGVRVVGGDVTRQSAPDGTVSLFGMIHEGVDLSITPQLTSAEARAALGTAGAGTPRGDPELVILPLSDGYHLSYYSQVMTPIEIINVYVDAASGAALRVNSEFETEVGSGKGAYGDDKKIATKPGAGGFIADDSLRPGAITTYDMRGNFDRTELLLDGLLAPAAADVAADSDNLWTDPVVVDAHVYSGWYYDYLFRRFGRSGTDNRNLRMAIYTHPVRLQDFFSATPDVQGLFYANAFHCGSCGRDGRGAIVFGEGAPRGAYGPFEVKPLSAALDVVAHELTHAVTYNSARLNGFRYSEAGSLNEAFSDVFGVSTAFYYFPTGGNVLQASYLLGKDLSQPTGQLFARSLSDPRATGDPDHYTQRNIGGDPHYNGVILGHAFYLAIEGGTNRTSGLTVQGVGAGNREQIEKAFFRALTALLPSNATFALARAATIQAARDLYGAGSGAERAITQAWDAVGVQPRTSPTATLVVNPATANSQTAAACGANPSWIVYSTVSGGASTVRITGWTSDDYNAAGTQIDHSVYSPANYASSFSYCGPGSTTLAAQADACAAMCWYLNPGVPTGSTQLNFTAVDDAGRTLNFSTPRVTLR